MTFLRAIRSLVLGETWALPIGVGVALLAAALVRAISGPDGWWRTGGGLLLFGGLLVALAISLRRRG